MAAAAYHPRQFPGTKLVEYPFPLSDGTMGRLIIPVDITRRDVDRLIALLHTLLPSAPEGA